MREIFTPFDLRLSRTTLPKLSFPILPINATEVPSVFRLLAKIAEELPRVTSSLSARISFPISGNCEIWFKMISTLSSPITTTSGQVNDSGSHYQSSNIVTSIPLEVYWYLSNESSQGWQDQNGRQQH